MFLTGLVFGVAGALFLFQHQVLLVSGKEVIRYNRLTGEAHQLNILRPPGPKSSPPVSRPVLEEITLTGETLEGVELSGHLRVSGEGSTEIFFGNLYNGTPHQVISVVIKVSVVDAEGQAASRLYACSVNVDPREETTFQITVTMEHDPAVEPVVTLESATALAIKSPEVTE